MRLYTFTHMYLSDIQKGIQSAHIVAELVNLPKTNLMELHFSYWSKRDKTIIVLNGGNCQSLEKIFNYLSTETTLQIVKFHEDEQSLNGALTAVGVLIPPSIYEADESQDMVILNYLRSFPLA